MIEMDIDNSCYGDPHYDHAKKNCFSMSGRRASPGDSGSGYIVKTLNRNYFLLLGVHTYSTTFSKDN